MMVLNFAAAVAAAADDYNVGKHGYVVMMFMIKK